MTKEPKNRKLRHLPLQAREHFIPYIQFQPKWLLSCGPANGEEYLAIRKHWPGIRLLGLEPSPVGYAYALKQWPADGILLQVAVWDRDETVTLHKAHDLMHGTCFVDFDHILADDLTGDSGDSIQVPARSLDSLDAEYGPFAEAILWLDVEGSERRALEGATWLIARGAIRAVNIEMRPQYATDFQRLFESWGFVSVRRYFECETYWDEVWVR